MTAAAAKTAEFTPGPWNSFNSLGELGPRTFAGGTTIIAMKPQGFSGDPENFRVPDIAECRANFRLIDAAPDLLAALKRLTDYSKKPSQADWQAADDAISKASEGKEVSNSGQELSPIGPDELLAQIKALTAANAILTDHIANLHNSVRHKFSAAVEAAADEAFREMSGIGALREAREAKATNN